MYRYRTEIHTIKKGSPSFDRLDRICFLAKNLYNCCIYTQRSLIINSKTPLNYVELERYCKINYEKDYRALPAQTAQQVIKDSYEAVKGYIKSAREYYFKGNNFTGEPAFPKYLHKTKGRFTAEFTSQQCKIKNGAIVFPKYLDGFTLKVHLARGDSLACVRVISRLTVVKVEVVYKKAISKSYIPAKSKLMSIDLGVDNLAAITFSFKKNPVLINGKGLKSYNQFFNKNLARLKSEAMKCNNRHSTKQIEQLYFNRNNFIRDFMHKASRKIVNIAVENSVSAIIIGHNKHWKQRSKMGSVNNQKFVSIPYNILISQIIYKAEEYGITVYLPDEYYTSGTSFLDNEQPIIENYDISRRINRGLFKSNTGYVINADVNASYQIFKKVFPKVTINGIEGFMLNPIKINIA